MDEAWKKARRNELWDAYVLKVPDVDPPAGAPDRTMQAVAMLRTLRLLHEEAVNANDKDQATHTAARGRMVLQLLTLEFGEWLLDAFELSRRLTHASDWEECERVALSFLLQIHEELGPHPHRPSIDPVSILVPRWLLRKLAGALEALNDGEVQGMLRPSVVGRHGDAWSWDKMRAGALDHVAFLHGQGQTKKMAQQRVAARMNIPAATLRDWERDATLKRGYEAAYEAGKLKIVFEDDPRYAEGDGNSVDSAALARLIQFKSEPSLADFGQSYRVRFGARHNPG
ncbi:hypothetical protein MKK64_12045 [Methylobacterium sp. E-025]|uniref:hypothetical protein n=1 Tax=Methylobacterium sp. E-025 TaxID=2836561 RepID=UPI001FBA14DD|nr:hypothetical protein [Methylobacterium sp. E-025]MCJ2111927.1 hypothetical protein [Methylobacterium sp. E-025]